MKNKKRLIKIIIFIITFSLLSIVKGFTANITYKDDPTSTFVKSSHPLLINHYKFSPETTGMSQKEFLKENGFNVIYSDESSYLKNYGYTLLIIAWWFELGLLIFYVFKVYRKK